MDYNAMLDMLSTINLTAIVDFSSITLSFLDFISPLAATEPSQLMLWGTFFYNILLVALGLGFVIFVHELGHFLAAKTFGVKCEKFYIGFDVPIKIGPIRLPSKLIHFKWGETEYGIGAIPLGGYVKMLGQDDDPRRAEEEAQRIRKENPNATADDPDRVQLDPRSFPAKSVGARMVIISAGVVMNLIFGVLMAAWAFHTGVKYDPAVIGEVIPGDPAWKNGILAGDKVLHVDNQPSWFLPDFVLEACGIDKKQDQGLSFRDMMMTVIFHGLRDPKKEVEIEIDRQGTRISKKFVGTTSHSDPKLIRRLTLGLGGSNTTRIAKEPAVSKQIQLGFDDSTKLVPAFEKADVIVGVNGEMLPISTHSSQPMEFALNEKMHPRLNETLTLQVQRGDKTVDVEWPPIPMKSFGLRFKPGPIVAILPDSAAAAAGIVEGDELIELNGKPIVDALTLPLLVASLHGQPAAMTIEHKDKTRFQFEWKVPENFIVSSGEGSLGPTGFELAGTGLVYSPSNVVSEVESTSLAAKSGMVAGDVVTQFKFDGSSKEDAEYLKTVFSVGVKTLTEETPLGGGQNIHYFHNLAQLFRVGMPVEISYERDGKVAKTNVDIHRETDWFWPERGVLFTQLQLEHKSSTLAGSLVMGVVEIRRRMGNVLEFLELLVKGKMPVKAVGGPAAIAVEATDAASKGIAPLLMFLTMLSANLAIINFLPIPALDGGHMMFLTAELIRGKPVDEALQMKLTMAGVLGLLCLMVGVFINDYINLSRMFGG